METITTNNATAEQSVFVIQMYDNSNHRQTRVALAYSEAECWYEWPNAIAVRAFPDTPEQKRALNALRERQAENARYGCDADAFTSFSWRLM